MKSFKKLAGLALALIMALALMAPAFAAESHTITVNKAIDGQTYTAYKIFDVESLSADGSTYSYKVSDGWAAFFATGGKGNGFIQNAPNYTEAHPYVNWVEHTASEVAQFAKDALEYATTTDGISEAGHATASKGTATITVDSLGYYLVDSSQGALCSLNVTTPNATVEEKNATDVPTPDKVVDHAVAGIGESLTYTVYVTVKKGAENYVVHDTMSKGLTFNNDVKVYTATKTDGVFSKDTGDDADVTTSARGTVTNTTNTETGVTTVEIPLQDTYLATYSASLENVNDEKYLAVEYTATINNDAVTVDTVTNSASLSYGTDSATNFDTTTTTLRDINIFKFHNVTADGVTTKVALPGAGFRLYGSATGTDEIPVVLVSGNTYRLAKTDETGVEILVDSTKATAKIVGLPNGTYYLAETTTPNGYNTLASRIEIAVAETTTADIDQDVENQAGTVLPDTGGIGTTIFYTLGGLLLVGSVILFVTKKRTGMAD